MKFSAAAVLAVAAGVSAGYSNVTYTTEIVTAVTTYCPAATEITYGGSTYTVTEATTLTITDCPCTITQSVQTVSSVYCNTCSSASVTGYHNTTAAAPTTVSSTAKNSVGTTSAIKTSATTTASSVPTAGAGKAAALSGAGLAVVLGLAAFLL